MRQSSSKIDTSTFASLHTRHQLNINRHLKRHPARQPKKSANPHPYIWSKNPWSYLGKKICAVDLKQIEHHLHKTSKRHICPKLCQYCHPIHPTSAWKISGCFSSTTPQQHKKNTRKFKKCLSPRHISADAASLFPVGGVGTKGVVPNSGKLLAEGNKNNHPRGTFHLNQKIKLCKNQEPDESYEFTLGKKNQSMVVLYRDFHVQCSSEYNPSTSWGTLLGALRQFHFQTWVESPIVTLDHRISLQMFFNSSVCTWYEADGNQQSLRFCLQVQ